MKKYLAIFIVLISINLISNAQSIIDGYTDKQSYRENETVTFYMNGNNPLHIPGLPLNNINGTTVITINGFGLMHTQTPSTTSPWADGFNYTSTATWVVPAGLASGYYLLGNKVPVIIKNSNYPSTADVVIIIPTNTINAYTTSGGKSLYENLTGIPTNDVNDHRATIVSFLRPVTAWDQAERMWGFLKWYNNAYPGSNINVIADNDMNDYGEITNAKLLIIIGHSEYWTREARLNFDQFVDVGHDALVLSGNTMWWQVRLENDPNNAQNHQLICHRGYAWGTGPGDYDNDPIGTTSPLQATYHWGERSLKYSTLGSIGSDWLRGGYGVDCGTSAAVCYGGYNGFHVTTPTSPVLAGMGYAVNDLIPFATGEYDGTLVKLDANGNFMGDNYGNPIVDVEALGFYRAEMIGFDEIINNINKAGGFADPGNPGAINICPFLVFQKTSTSGTIINTNSNEWCSDWVIAHSLTNAINPVGNPNCGSSSTLLPDPNIPQITANMINLMLQDQTQQLHGDNLFSTLPVTYPSFTIDPVYSNVSYNICSSGAVDITPTGIYLTEGYRIDNGFTWDNSAAVDMNTNSFDASVDFSCTNYNNGLRQMQPANTTPVPSTAESLDIAAKESLSSGNKNKRISQTKNMDGSGIKIIPNPTNGLFEVYLNALLVVKELSVFNSLNQKITTIKNIVGSKVKMDLSTYAKGIYYLKIEFSNNETEYKKIVVK